MQNESPFLHMAHWRRRSILPVGRELLTLGPRRPARRTDSCHAGALPALGTADEAGPPGVFSCLLSERGGKINHFLSTTALGGSPHENVGREKPFFPAGRAQGKQRTKLYWTYCKVNVGLVPKLS